MHLSRKKRHLGWGEVIAECKVVHNMLQVDFRRGNRVCVRLSREVEVTRHLCVCAHALVIAHIHARVNARVCTCVNVCVHAKIAPS